MEVLGAEYLMASAIIAQIENGRDTTSISDILSIGEKLQVAFNRLGMDVLVCRTDFINVIYNFDYYFEYVSINNYNCVKPRGTISINDLKRRFQAYHSLDVLRITYDICKKHKYKNF